MSLPLRKGPGELHMVHLRVRPWPGRLSNLGYLLPIPYNLGLCHLYTGFGILIKRSQAFLP